MPSSSKITINDIKDIHLDCSPSIVPLETLEISHSTWPEPVRIVTNYDGGVDAQLETGETVRFDFAPLLLDFGTTSDDLDQSINVTLGDLGEIVPPLIKKIRESESDELPEVIYRRYAFDAASMTFAKPQPIDITKGLYVEQMNRDYQATTFEAKTHGKNSVTCGRTLNLRDYPDQMGLL